MNKLELAFKAFDDYNKKDPTIFEWEDVKHPQEYFFALALHNWILRLNPAANEVLLLASRCQHIGRWERLRSNYPEGREGYLTWRRELGIYHAEIAGKILQEIGYNDFEIESVKRILLKKKIKVDADVQTMENALCLVFLELQYEEFLLKHSPEKVINILKKLIIWPFS